jgi:hypothetical protein
MKIDESDPPREFEVGGRGTRLSHVADAWLDADELVTFRTESGTELDVTRKAWGYYATSSFNQRLPEHGLRPALTMSSFEARPGTERMYLLLCESGQEDRFNEYLEAEGMRLVGWLDTDAAVTRLAQALEAQPQDGTDG